ncbi:MAG: 3D domain-containing protein [Pyrinomonadaceae bacterium]|nr:3D domain-containing protein [Pyrinomonadaceae bacterium]MCX7639563.1 3D domain-containing protein [Pyrinomonadaceae bacterium]MDW8303956.1 3D domain-containing protein [Acidobacteriota bacterium]
MKGFARRSFFMSLAVLIVSFSGVQPQVQEGELRESGEKLVVENVSAPESESKEKLEAIEKAVMKGDRNATRMFVATAYCLKGKTASGSYVRRGIIAADPRVLPLGSVVQINAGAYSGSYVVADTGGKIKGNKIDIWVSKCSEALRFGRRLVKLTVISKRK